MILQVFQPRRHAVLPRKVFAPAESASRAGSRDLIFLWLIFVFLPLLFFCGCANWKSEPTVAATELRLPANRMSPDSVALEVAVAELDEDQLEDLRILWGEVDQQDFALDTRRCLDLNGMRCAIVPVRTPASLSRLVEPEEVDRESLPPLEQAMFDKGLLKPEPRLIAHTQVQNRQGDQEMLQTSALYSRADWQIRQVDSVSHGSGHDVRGVWKMTTRPESDGSVKVVLTPQIHHGDQRQQIGVRQKTFLFENSQPVTPVQCMKIEAHLELGESLLIGATQDLDGLGALFFQSPLEDESNSSEPLVGLTADDLVPESLDPFDLEGLAALPVEIPEEDTNVNLLAESKRQRIMIIRLVQTQKNDLFDRRNRKEPLVSTLTE